jgi:ACT domain-containing protein
MITLDLELRDIPGELIRALTPISNMGVNIFSVIHLREKKTDGRVPVRVVINDIDGKLLNEVINKLEGMDIIITKVNEMIRKTDIDIVVVGHVVDTDVKDTIDRLNKYGIVVDLDLSMPDPYKESSARMKVIIDTNNLKEFCKELDNISKEKNLLFIKSF